MITKKSSKLKATGGAWHRALAKKYKITELKNIYRRAGGTFILLGFCDDVDAALNTVDTNGTAEFIRLWIFMYTDGMLA